MRSSYACRATCQYSDLSDHAVELPGDVFDLDIETVVHPLNVFLDLKMLDRLSQFANALQSNKPVGYAVPLSRTPLPACLTLWCRENLEGLAHLHASTREQVHQSMLYFSC